ncbi:hypothetical protein V8G54_004001 [Vigna mungo]|uniref:Copine C-terminal domain-containing protein n=1 Tax=Vigna mungo TaxID=3915 RepID=A0AAQ3SCA8_VIGMU
MMGMNRSKNQEILPKPLYPPFAQSVSAIQYLLFPTVTRSVDTQHGQLSPQEQKTIDTIVKASEYPLSIVLVGVGDGPWEMMKEFDDNIPARAFDNFQFVNFTEIMSRNVDSRRKETDFALSALMEIPSQYKATIDHGILGARRGHSPDRVPLPPPHYERTSISSTTSFRPNSSQQSAPTYSDFDSISSTTSFRPNSSQQSAPTYSDFDKVNMASSSGGLYDNKVCPICLTNGKDMAFGCGHQHNHYKNKALLANLAWEKGNKDRVGLDHE